MGPLTGAIVLALASALAYGSSDFLGGLAGRRAPASSVAFSSQLIGLAGMALVVPLAGGSLHAADLVWGVGAGVGGGIGVALLYRGLAVGQMSVVAPVSAAGAACVPVLVGLLSGERPGPLALVGMGVAIAAVMLLSFVPGHADRALARAGVATGLGAGAGFGAFFVLLDHVHAGSGLWPLVAAREASLLVLGVTVAVTGHAFRPTGAGRVIVAVGLLDVAANFAYLLAAHRGLLSIVALLTSLYPAVTVVLARAVLGERLTRVQTAGLVAAVTAVAVIAVAV
ncbi:MAG TPA: EamA family transporter [Acidimicrobiales bacterium]|nr:EamA family transporter [Acidimicrobiales bacterium]